MRDALLGAVSFLTRLPVAYSEPRWEAFITARGRSAGGLRRRRAPRRADAGGRRPHGTVAFAYLAVVFAVTGINHLDGVADAGDAAVVHGDPADRRTVLKDTTTGVGAIAAVVVVVAGLVTGSLGVAALPTWTAVGSSSRPRWARKPAWRRWRVSRTPHTTGWARSSPGTRRPARCQRSRVSRSRWPWRPCRRRPRPARWRARSARAR